MTKRTVNQAFGDDPFGFKAARKRDPFKAGDRVRILLSGGGIGETLWEIVSTDGLRAGHCIIREADTDYAPQRFDTSLLKKVDG